MENIKKLKAHQEKSKSKKFSKKILALIPELKPYIRHRLFLGEQLGILPKNMYRSTGIIDDAIISLYQSDISDLQSKSDLRLKLFEHATVILNEIFQQEKWHQEAISTDKILHQELNKLKEKFTFNADEDFIMNEELTDISYHQKDFTEELFLYDDSDQIIKQTFNLSFLDDVRKKLFTKLYQFLSIEASDVVDLHIFGKLNTSEIAQINKVEEEQVRAIILEVKDTIHNLLDFDKK